MSEQLQPLNGETSQQRAELLSTREEFYRAVNLQQNVLFCGDDRESIVPIYIHLLGGVLNIAYNAAIIRETNEPGSVKSTFNDEAAKFTQLLIEVVKANPGVHSDEDSEGSKVYQHDKTDGGVGCGYGNSRQAISAHIYDKRQSILDTATELFPDDFSDEVDRQFGEQVADAHGRLSKRNSFFTSGREVVKTAINKGAKIMLVKGKHVAKDGILNDVPESSLQTTIASKNNLATYDHDIWAADEIFASLQPVYSTESRQVRIAGIIDAIGTLEVLGVTTIAVRRKSAN